MIESYLAVRKSFLVRQPVENRLGPFRARLIRGAHCVAFETDGRGGSFVGTSCVINVREATENGRTIQFAEFEDVVAFDHPRDFHVFAGSLERIRYVFEPQRHFSRNIVKLSRIDFSVITRNQVDVPRSTFRYLFAALPMEMQTDFLRQQGVDLEKFYSNGTESAESLLLPLRAFFDKELRPDLDLVRSLTEACGSVRVDDMPGINALVMTDETGERPIPLGNIAESVERLLSTNRLFTEGNANQTLLAEMPSQLAAGCDRGTE